MWKPRPACAAAASTRGAWLEARASLLLGSWGRLPHTWALCSSPLLPPAPHSEAPPRRGLGRLAPHSEASPRRGLGRLGRRALEGVSAGGQRVIQQALSPQPGESFSRERGWHGG